VNEKNNGKKRKGKGAGKLLHVTSPIRTQDRNEQQQEIATACLIIVFGEIWIKNGVGLETSLEFSAGGRDRGGGTGRERKDPTEGQKEEEKEKGG